MAKKIVLTILLGLLAIVLVLASRGDIYSTRAIEALGQLIDVNGKVELKQYDASNTEWIRLDNATKEIETNNNDFIIDIGTATFKIKDNASDRILIDQYDNFTIIGNSLTIYTAASTFSYNLYVEQTFVRLASVASLGTCDATTRGQIKYKQGGTGTADMLCICVKDASEAYSWKSLISGGTCT